MAKAVRRGVRTGSILFAGIIGILLAFAVSLVYGTKDLHCTTVWQALFAYDPDIKGHQIVQDIRLPRALAAALIGAYLALSGAVMQALTRNPLAEPSLLGVSYGAAFALVITIAFFPEFSIAGQTIGAMAGAGLAVLFVFAISAASKGNMTPVKLALAGVATGMFLSSLTSGIALYFDVSKEMGFWQAGGLAGMDWRAVKMLAVAGLLGILIVAVLARALTLLNLGVDVTKGLGIHIRTVQTLGVLAVLILTGSSVAVSGPIGFVGLVVPHISRMLVGPDYRFSLPVTAVLGSLLLVLADVGSRMIHPPFETPVGVVTAFIGVPFFLYFVRNERSRTA